MKSVCEFYLKILSNTWLCCCCCAAVVGYRLWPRRKHFGHATHVRFTAQVAGKMQSNWLRNIRKAHSCSVSDTIFKIRKQQHTTK